MSKAEGHDSPHECNSCNDGIAAAESRRATLGYHMPYDIETAALELSNTIPVDLDIEIGIAGGMILITAPSAARIYDWLIENLGSQGAPERWHFKGYPVEIKNLDMLSYSW